MYSVGGYGRMISDSGRMDAYVAALRQAIKPGAVVADLGSGIGLFALLACQMGARRVYAIEPGEVIQVGREAALANGFGDRIEFLPDFSTQVTLPEPADVIVSDLRGVLPWFRKHIPSICDARRRLLAPNGVLIPQRDTVWAAVVEAPDEYSKLMSPWEHHNRGFDLTAARTLVTNTWSKEVFKSGQLLVDPICWQTLDYYQVEEPNVKSDIVFSVIRSGTARGLSVWFDSDLVDGIGFSNRPGSAELIYGSAFFPFPHHVEVSIDDQIELKLSANLVGEDYIWRWETRVFAQGQTKQIKADFKQSSFFSTPLPFAQLRKRAAGYVPTLNQEGQVNALILHLMDGKIPLEKIAMRVAERFPERYSDWHAALNEVTDLSQKFSQ